MFYFENIKGKNFLKSDFLSEVEHFFTTKESVIRSGEKDLEKDIYRNIELIKEYLNIQELITPHQTHSCNVDTARIGEFDYPNTDALILDNKEQAIYLNFADCTPVILYDTNKKIGAISHAGWRGTVQRIVPKTIEKMQSNPQDIIAVIGPAICEKCYEVGEDVFKQLRSSVQDFTGLSKGFNVDLKRINARQLEEMGVKQIDICPYCTSCDNDIFFSYRKENGITSRHSAVLKL